MTPGRRTARTADAHSSRPGPSNPGMTSGRPAGQTVGRGHCAFPYGRTVGGLRCR